MPMPFNPNQYSYSNYQSHSGIHGINSYNRQFQMNNSSNSALGGFNHMYNQSNIFHNSNHLVSNRGLGQTNISQLTCTNTTQSTPFAIGQRVTNYEVRNTPVLPQRIQLVQNSVNVDYFPVRDQHSMSPPPGFQGDWVCVTEVVTTQLLNSSSTRERFLGHNQYENGNPWNFQNQANHPRVSHNYYSQNPNYFAQQRNQYSHTPNPSFFQIPPNGNVTNNNATPRPNIGETIFNPQPLNVYFPDETSTGTPIVGDSVDFSGESDEDYDGRTHSLPHEKYGPYTCPRCNGVFSTSQMFAAHMGSHYKHETAEERRRRHLAKHGNKKSTRLLSVGPQALKRQSAAGGRRKSNEKREEMISGSGSSSGRSFV